MAAVYFFKFPLEDSLGGAEFHTLKIAQYYKSRGYEVKLFTSDYRLFRLFEKNKLPRRRIFVGFEPTSKWSLWLWPLTYLIARSKFKKLLQEIPRGSMLFMQSLIEKLVLTPLIHNAPLTPSYLKRGEEELSKVIWLEHKIPGRWLKLNPLKFRYLRLARKVRIITVSKFAQEEFVKLGVPESNIKAIYPLAHVPNSTFHIQHSEFFTIGILSRLDPEKGVLDFVKRILPELKNRSNWRLVIAGEGIDGQNIQQLTDNNNLRKQIKLLGLVNNLDEFFAQISVFVYPTKVAESFGISVLEAKTRGIPVVASNLGALPEIINHGVNGFLVDPSSTSSWKQFLEIVAVKTYR